MDVLTTMVEFPGGNPVKKTMGFLARPKEKGMYPTVIIIHEIWGLVDHIKDVASRLALESYVALASARARMRTPKVARHSICQAESLGESLRQFHIDRS